MPYTIVKQNGLFCVHKKNEDGTAGKKIACHATQKEAVAQIGAIESAEKILAEKSINDVILAHSDILREVVYVLIGKNQLDDARKIIKKITTPYHKVELLVSLAEHYAWNGDRETALSVLQEAEKLARKEENANVRPYRLASVATALARIGYVDEALIIAQGLETQISQEHGKLLLEYIKARSDFDTSEWSGAAANWPSTEAYCQDCLIDLNEAGQEKVQAKCKLPFRKHGASKWNINALRAMGSGARGLAAVNAPADAKRAAARKIAGKWRSAFGKEPPVSITRYVGEKSFVSFKQDKEGNTWFIGLFSNKFKDRQNEILSEAAHQEYVKWVIESGVRPQVTLFHMPRAVPGFWYQVMKSYEKGMINTSTLNNLLKDFYKEYAITEAEKVFYVNGFVGVAGRVYPDRLAWVNNIAAKAEDIGMSHGFIPAERDGNIYTKYRSFEFSVLPKSWAANVWTKANLVEVAEMPLEQEVAEFLNEIQEGTAEQVEQQTGEMEQELEAKGVEFKATDLITQVVEQMKFDEFVQVLGDRLTTLTEKLNAMEARLKEMERSEDEKIASRYQPNWQQFLTPASKSESNVDEEKKEQPEIFDFLSHPAFSGGKW